MEGNSSDESEDVSLLERMRRHDRRIGRRLYRQWRIGLTIGAPLFIALGLLELAGLTNAGTDPVSRSGSRIDFIILGALMAAVRLTWFRDPPGKKPAA